MKFASLLAVLAAYCIVPAQTYLAYKFKVGQKRHYSMHFSLSEQFSFQGPIEPAKSDPAHEDSVDMWIDEQVKDIAPNGTATIGEQITMKGLMFEGTRAADNTKFWDGPKTMTRPGDDTVEDVPSTLSHLELNCESDARSGDLASQFLRILP